MIAVPNVISGSNLGCQFMLRRETSAAGSFQEQTPVEIHRQYVYRHIEDCERKRRGGEGKVTQDK